MSNKKNFDTSATSTSGTTELRPGDRYVDASGMEQTVPTPNKAFDRLIPGYADHVKQKIATAIPAAEVAENIEFNKQQDVARAAKSKPLRDLMSDLVNACQSDGSKIDATKAEIEKLKVELSQGYTTTAEAGKSILAIYHYLVDVLADVGQIKDFICRLTYLNKDKVEKKVPWNSAAQHNYAIPLAIHGYKGTKNRIHIYRVAMVVGYAFNELKMAPEEFPAWLTGTHEYSQGTKTISGSGLFAAWMAVSEAKAQAASKTRETPADRAAMRTNAVLLSITDKLPLATIDENQMGVMPNNGLYALVGRRTAEGTVEIIHAVPDSDGKLLPEMLGRIYTQLELTDKKARELNEKAGMKPLMSDIELYEIGLDAMDGLGQELAA